MPYQNDTSTLADIVSPAYAAGQSMQQNDLENQKQQMANEVYQQQMPALGQQTGLENLFRQAQTSQTNALAQGQGLSNIEKAGTMGTGMAATNAANQTKYTGEQLQRFGQVGTLAGQAAGLMDQIPEAARPAAMASLAQKYGVDPQALGPLASGNPDDLRNFSQKMIQSSQQYQEKLMEENTRGQYGVQQAQVTGQAHLAATQELTRGREAVAQTNAEVKKQLAPLQAILGQLTQKVAAGTATPEERATLQWAQNAQQLIRSGSPFQAGITGTNVQGNVPPVPATSGGGNPPPPATGPTTGGATENLAKSSFGSYEPDKYEYGINPATGNFGRRPKGQ